jgi:nitrogen fixation protein FixH
MNLRLPLVRAGTPGRQLTGRMVLCMLLGFFGLVIAVNLFMVREAISTFGGVDTPSSYQAGLNFKADEAAAAAQDALHWRVDAQLAGAEHGQALTVTARDASGKPLSGFTVTAHFAHPADERHDLTVALRETEPGSYRGIAVVEPGQWGLDLAISRAGTRLFQSTNRVMVQ